MNALLRSHARSIWDAAVMAVRAGPLVQRAFAEPGLAALVQETPHLWVVGGGKAGAAMAEAVEQALADRLDRVEGIVNVPADVVRPLQKIRLHAARPASVNFPTPEGVRGVQQMLEMMQRAGPHDVALGLFSGGGSALLPAPAEGITLQDKLAVTQRLHQSGATIHEMNAVRKHLSAVKGGRLAQAFRGQAFHSLILSDVIGDPLDVIASGPTAADPTTFAQALEVLDRYRLRDQVPVPVRVHLERGAAGEIPETPKLLAGSVHNHILGNNALALAEAQKRAEALGYQVVNLGSYLEGETCQVAIVHAGIVRSILEQGVPLAPPVCLLSGGETTVTLMEPHGRGGRNQEFVLAALVHLGPRPGVVVLSGGTDGEDGPTDAAGALADATTLEQAAPLRLDAGALLARHDAYPFFDAVGGLLRTGLTQTNVMDVRVFLLEGTGKR